MVIELPRWKGKVAVVTGASAGIGAAICEQLVEAGLKVVGLARRVEKLDALAEKLEGKRGKLYGYKADIRVEEEVVKAFKWVKDNVGSTSILVNNAGVARKTYLIDGDAVEWKRVLDTNVMGLCLCTREAIKHMKDKNIDGHIVHINSVAGHQVANFPGLNIYPASKYAVTALTETLRHELNALDSKIKITSVSPGVVKTEIFVANDLMSSLGNISIEDLSKMSLLESEDVADAVLYVLSTPPHVLINELTLRSVCEKFE